MHQVIAFDSAKFATALTAGYGPQLLQEVVDSGITFDERLGEIEWLMPHVNKKNWQMAIDAQPTLNLISNSGIPSWMATVVDPKVIETLYSPMMAAIILGESQKGDWATEVAMFLTGESTGQVSAYGDYSQNGSSGTNVNFPQRQNYIYQCFMQYGELELARAAKAKLDWASRQQVANALTLKKYQNDSYFYGVANMQNYGLLNDPALPAPITPTYSWLTNSSATANTIYNDIVRMFTQLVAQSNGVLKTDAPMVLVMSNVNSVVLKYITTYNTNSVEVLLKQNFPNIRIETAVQYTTAAGQLVQLICTELEGQKTAECVYSSLLRAHAMIPAHSSWSQKRSQGTFGTILYRPYLIASMLG